MICRFDVGIFA